MSEDPKDQKPGEQPRHSLLVTFVIAVIIVVLAGFLAWGVPSLVKTTRDGDVVATEHDGGGNPVAAASPAPDPSE